MHLIAHRGFASIYPENTVIAVDNAAAVADGIEIDVRRCKSGELVVIHDRTVDRVTDHSGPVGEYTRSDLEAMYVLGTGEAIPTLEAVLRTIPDHVGVNVEIKEAEIATDALHLIDSIHPNAIISSFSQKGLAACCEADPTVPTAYLTDEPGIAGVEKAIDLGCEYLHLAAEVCTKRTVCEAHRAGLRVNAWTIDAADRVASLAALDVDGVIADRPDVLSEVSA